MSQEPLVDNLQEAVLAVLAFNDKYGATIAAQVVPENFDGPYYDAATAILAYRRKYQRAPGNAHLESLFSRAKLDPGDKKTHAFRRLLVTLSAQAEVLNAEYVASRTQDHVRSQKLKSALMQANERYLQGGDDAVAEVEAILHTALRYRQTTLDAGTYLHQLNKLPAFREEEDEAYLLGIPELDRYKIGPAPGQLLLFIAPKNSGKSWAAVHIGRQALLQKARVLHVTLEMSEEDVLERYYQSFFGISTFDEQFTKTVFELDELDRLLTFKARPTKPKLSFTQPDIKKILRKKLLSWEAKFRRLVIKGFPSGQLTMNALRGYLDHLEAVEHFVPNVLIVDYPDLFRIDQRDFRVSLGRVFVELRGLGVERKMAVFTPTQSGRDSIGARRVSSRDVTEDISKVFTADKVLTYSQTEAEYEYGVARLSVDHARRAPKHQQVLIAQSYATGQYVLQSAALNSAYWERLKELSGDETIGDGDG